MSIVGLALSSPRIIGPEREYIVSNDYAKILNLLHGFAQHFDMGQFDAALSLFSKGEFVVGEGKRISAREMAQIWQNILILYDGFPKTRHIVTNPVVEFTDNQNAATCRSYYTVIQSTDILALQPIITGRYHDRFAKDDGEWYFVERDYRHMDMTGDLSHHLTKTARDFYAPSAKSL